jgi:hypothetical protein
MSPRRKETSRPRHSYTHMLASALKLPLTEPNCNAAHTCEYPCDRVGYKAASAMMSDLRTAQRRNGNKFEDVQFGAKERMAGATLESTWFKIFLWRQKNEDDYESFE